MRLIDHVIFFTPIVFSTLMLIVWAINDHTTNRRYERKRTHANVHRHNADASD